MDVAGEKDEMELGENSKRGGRERKGDVDWIWENKNRRMKWDKEEKTLKNGWGGERIE